VFEIVKAVYLKNLILQVDSVLTEASSPIGLYYKLGVSSHMF